MGKLKEAEIAELSITERLLKELELLDKLDFKGYSIRKSSRIQISVFSKNIIDLVDWVNTMYATVNDNEYTSQKWKAAKRNYHQTMMDEYFSEDGHDIRPEDLIRGMMGKLEFVCVRLATSPGEEPHPRIKYYHRQFKTVLEDSIEVIHQLRIMLQ